MSSNADPESVSERIAAHAKEARWGSASRRRIKEERELLKLAGEVFGLEVKIAEYENDETATRRELALCKRRLKELQGE